MSDPDTDTNIRHHQPAQDTLYFNGACALCRAEIDKLQSHNNGTLCVVDIHGLADTQSLTDTQSMDDDAKQSSTEYSNSQSPNKAQLLDKLHLQTSDGQWLTGLEANVAAWQHTRHGKYWRLLLLAPIKPFATLAYELWLRYYRWRQSQ